MLEENEVAPSSGACGCFYLHGLTKEGRSGWDGPGLLAGSVIENLSEGGLSALMSPLGPGLAERTRVMEAFKKEAGDPELQAAHKAILARLHAALGDFIPFPPRTLYDDLDVLRQRIREKRSRLDEMLDYVHAAGEWSVRVCAPEGSLRDAQGDLEDLAATHLRALGSTYEWLHTELSRVARDSIKETLALGPGETTPAFEGAYLVENAVVPEFTQEIQRIEQGLSHYGWTVSVSGPGPAISFLRLGF